MSIILYSMPGLGVSCNILFVTYSVRNISAFTRSRRSLGVLLRVDVFPLSYRANLLRIIVIWPIKWVW